jgi:hypothetical protein
MKRLTVALALCCSLFCSPASAKTFIGVLWPMFGPLPAIGLVELVAELKMMPDVEVSTYLHQNWPDLVDDIARQPPGTRTVVVGYSLGANSSVFVANKSKYIDVIIALQPSMLSWNPAVTGQVGRYIEVYNPNPSMTFGGMGSKKLVGPNIEYIENNDSHPGAQFSSEFRNLVKSEITRVSTEPVLMTAQGPTPASPVLSYAPKEPALATSSAAMKATAPTATKVANTPAPTKVANAAAPAKPAPTKLETAPSSMKLASADSSPKVAVSTPRRPASQFQDTVAFLDGLTSMANSGSLAIERQLTVADMVAYADRNFGTARTAELVPANYDYH